MDKTGSFFGVISVSAGNCVTAGILMMCCFIINDRMTKIPENPTFENV